MEQKRIIFLLIDALRQDHAVGMKIYKYLAERGVKFMAHRTTNTWTLPALGTLHSGRLAPDHGVIAWQPENPIPVMKAHQTMAEVISALGFYTVAFSTHGWGRGHFGFHRGFKKYYEGVCWLHQLEETKKGLMECKDNLFAWIHILDLHDWFRHGDMDIVDWRTAIKEGRIDKPMVERARKEYQAGVDEVDDTLMEFIVGFEPDENTTVVMTADHGEALFEYNDRAFQHGQCYTDEVKELMDIPLVVSGLKINNVVAGYRTFDYDIMPTMVEIAASMGDQEKKIPLNGVEGRSVFDHRLRTLIEETTWNRLVGGVDEPQMTDDEKERHKQELRFLGYLS